ncbi:MAG TPA: OmpH family outer membrane protein [Pyrinomonadaceae bacterium]
MKKFYFLSASLLLALSCVAVQAQRPAAQVTPPATQTPASTNVNLPTSKLAIIYTEDFLDAKTGILKFGSLITKLNSEFQKEKDALTQMSQRAQQLQEEIAKLQGAPAGTPIDGKSIQAKNDQLDQLKRDIQRRGEDAQTAYNKRRADLFAPIQDEIGKALEVFAKARNINIILDGTQVPLMYAAESIDITKAFVADFNSKNPVTASTTPPQ